MCMAVCVCVCVKQSKWQPRQTQNALGTHQMSGLSCSFFCRTHTYCVPLLLRALFGFGLLLYYFRTKLKGSFCNAANDESPKQTPAECCWLLGWQVLTIRPILDKKDKQSRNWMRRASKMYIQTSNCPRVWVIPLLCGCCHAICAHSLQIPHRYRPMPMPQASYSYQTDHMCLDHTNICDDRIQSKNAAKHFKWQPIQTR